MCTFTAKRRFLKGIVIKSTGSWVVVKLQSGDRLECRLKGQFRLHGIRHTTPVAIGDHVEVDVPPGDTTGVIRSIGPRDNYIIRKATKLSKQSHIIAANLDHAYLVATLAMPRTSTGFIDRFLVTAAGYYIPASIIFNKCDLYGSELEGFMQELEDVYGRAGYACHRVSALTGVGVAPIRELLKGKVSLFAGHSGAGKSALIRAIDPSLNPRIGAISEAHNKGMHTTTFAEMYEIDGGGFIVDTPGIREFGLVGFDRAEIPRCFPEMDRLLPRCQFKNCTHVHEPGCAVKMALETGEVSHIRYNSYLSILDDR